MEYVIFTEFLDKVGARFGDVDGNSSLEDLRVSTEDFEDFLREEFEFDKVQMSIVRSSLKGDMILFDIFNAFFV